jgi:hypothetical protein
MAELTAFFESLKVYLRGRVITPGPAGNVGMERNNR